MAAIFMSGAVAGTLHKGLPRAFPSFVSVVGHTSADRVDRVDRVDPGFPPWVLTGLIDVTLLTGLTAYLLLRHATRA